MKKTYETPLLLRTDLAVLDVIMVSEGSELDFDVGDLVGGIGQ